MWPTKHRDVMLVIHVYKHVITCQRFKNVLPECLKSCLHQKYEAVLLNRFILLLKSLSRALIYKNNSFINSHSLAVIAHIFKRFPTFHVEIKLLVPDTLSQSVTSFQVHFQYVGEVVHYVYIVLYVQIYKTLSQV